MNMSRTCTKREISPLLANIKEDSVNPSKTSLP
jgi:hypothetical protein